MADIWADFPTVGGAPAAAGADPWADFKTVAPPVVTAPMAPGMSLPAPAPTSIGPGPTTASMPDQPMPLRPWGDVGLDALQNLPRSLWKDVARPAYEALKNDPLGVASSAVNTVAGIPMALPQPLQSPERKAEIERNLGPDIVRSREGAKAVGQDVLGDYAKYADMPTLQDRLAYHPGRVAMDVASVLPTVGLPTTSPLTAIGRGANYAGRAADAVVSPMLGTTTGIGRRSIRDIGSAGRELGSGLEMDNGFVPKTGEAVENARAVTQNMKNPDAEELVRRAKDAFGQATQERGSNFRAGMKDVEAVDRVLPFDKIEAAVSGANDVAAFKPKSGGSVELNPSAEATKSEIFKLVDDWKNLNPESPLFKNVLNKDTLTPENFHTPIGLDALKRLVGDARDSASPGTPAYAAASRVYTAIGSEIRKAAPEYAGVMADYQSASGKLKEAERALSLGQGSTTDTAARKLLSATRDNVNTNFGARGKTLDEMSKYDSTLPYAIAGMAANSPMPRGIGGALSSSGLGLGAAGAAMLTNPYAALALIPTAIASSPRVVGNLVYMGGRVMGSVEDVAKGMGISADRLRAGELGAYQTGHNDETAQRSLSMQGNPYYGGPR